MIGVEISYEEIGIKVTMKLISTIASVRIIVSYLLIINVALGTDFAREDPDIDGGGIIKPSGDNWQNTSGVARLNEAPMPNWIEQANWDVLHGMNVPFLTGHISLDRHASDGYHAVFNNDTHIIPFIDHVFVDFNGKHRYMSTDLAMYGLTNRDNGQQLENGNSVGDCSATIWGSEFQRRVKKTREIFQEIDGFVGDLRSSNLATIGVGVGVYYLARRARPPAPGTVRQDTPGRPGGRINNDIRSTFLNKRTCDNPRTGDLVHYDVNDLELGKCALAMAKLDRRQFQLVNDTGVLKNLGKIFQGYVSYYKGISTTAYVESRANTDVYYSACARLVFDCYVKHSSDVFVC